MIRVSGPGAIAIVSPLVRSRTPLAAARSHHLSKVTLVDPRSGQPLDEALCAVMRAPRSYTGEDTVELSCHGSPALVRLLLERLLALGARMAEPGEFTRRAFLNGRLDLAQAEAVALMISARTERGIALAARAMAGGLSEQLRALRLRVLDVVASLEVSLDFPEDEAGPGSDKISREIDALCVEAARLVRSATVGHKAHAGLTIAIVGPANAGKSSLFNALLGRDRAIVTPEAGTTRDVVEGAMVIRGTPVTLLDTAGLGEPRDAIDAEGMRRSRQAIEASDLLVVVADGSESLSAEAERVLGETRGKPRIVALSKADLGHPEGIAWPDGEAAVRTSVKNPGGLDSLSARLAEEVARRTELDGDEGGMVASLRQLELLTALTRALEAARAVLPTHPIEIALVDLRSALESVSQLLGVEIGDAILDAVFTRFCVGK